ncbi:MAG: N-acetyltransferase [Hyphomicrobiales bacterium]|nr:MAG: N-acetyltransferase [Hyphomicrobiales bacterium]
MTLKASKMRMAATPDVIHMRELAGEGITLEPQVAAHASGLFAVIRDPDLYTYIDDKEPVSEAALRQRLARLESRQSPDGSEHWLNWVVRAADGQIAGYVQATVTPDHAAEIAYVLGKAFWRHGIGTIACRLMIGELRARYGVTRLTATLDPANAASVALLHRLGLRQVWEDIPGNEVGYALEL